MREKLAIGAAASALLLGGCAGYHQEVAALRMQRPASDAALAPYATASAGYPSVGGDILRDVLPPSAGDDDAAGGGPAPAAAP
jgi:hypothetical protein